ncbi:MAG: hypothetical protein KAS17_11450, partial [Victivallaceae bacterium]|nr:hypothetical protein [Victivallaceae bacterium]
MKKTIKKTTKKVVKKTTEIDNNEPVKQDLTETETQQLLAEEQADSKVEKPKPEQAEKSTKPEQTKKSTPRKDEDAAIVFAREDTLDIVDLQKKSMTELSDIAKEL